MSGGGFLKADNEEVYCGVGDVQIISKGVADTITASSDTPLRYIHFAFDFFDYEPKTLADFYAECKHLVIHDNGDIRNVLNMLVDEYFNDAVFTEVARIGLIQFLLVVVWRKVHLQTDRYDPVVIKKPMTSAVYDIIKYIDKNLSEQLTVSGIAEQFSYSSTYISRLFKAKTGLSLKEYIIAMKMNYAEKLLREGKSSLSEISGLVGYESVQSFSKQFKKITGKTPGDLGEVYQVYVSFRSYRSIPGLGGDFTNMSLAGGGVTIDWGVHFFDIVMFCCGDPAVKTVSAEKFCKLGNPIDKYVYETMWAGPPKTNGVCDVEEGITGMIRTEGPSITFNGAWAQNIGEDEMFIDFIGTKGGIRLQYGGDFVFWSTKNNMLTKTEFKMNDETSMFQNEINEFIDCIESGKKLPSHIDTNVITAQMMDAIYKSANEHVEIML